MLNYNCLGFFVKKIKKISIFIENNILLQSNLMERSKTGYKKLKISIT